MKRAPRLLALAGLVALLSTGCGTVRTGAAATVGDERITVTHLQDVVARGLADPTAQQNVGSDRAGFEREVLSRLVQHLVLAAAAKEHHVAITGADVDATYDDFVARLGGPDQLLAEALKSGIAKQDLRGIIADAALRDALADVLTADVPVPAADLQKAYADNIGQFDQVHSAHILVASQAQAQQLLAQVKAAPEQFASLAARYSLDTSNKDNGGDIGFQARASLEKPYADAIFTSPPGSFVLAHTRFGFHVIHVIERRTTTLEQATKQLRRLLLQPQRQQAIDDALRATATRLGVHVNPRFGAFDATTATVDAVPICPSTAVSSPSPRADGNQAEQPAPQPSC